VSTLRLSDYKRQNDLESCCKPIKRISAFSKLSSTTYWPIKVTIFDDMLGSEINSLDLHVFEMTYWILSSRVSSNTSCSLLSIDVKKSLSLKLHAFLRPMTSFLESKSSESSLGKALLSLISIKFRKDGCYNLLIYTERLLTLRLILPFYKVAFNDDISRA